MFKPLMLQYNSYRFHILDSLEGKLYPLTRFAQSQKSIGVLLANTGSPDSPTPQAVRRYLAQFLADRRVIDLPRWLWLPILKGIILNVRPARSARLYRRIWSEDGSPLVHLTQNIAAGLTAPLSRAMQFPVSVVAGMRYGNPSIAVALQALRAAGATDLLILPLFPQYSRTTTASILDAVEAELAAWPSIPPVQVIEDYHDHPAYIQALQSSLLERWVETGRPERLLISYHGIPLSYVKRGDPYPVQCQTTSRLLTERLGLSDSEWRIAYQSRFGSMKWLQPSARLVLEEFAAQKTSHLSVITPGFAVDCLETLGELSHEGRSLYEASGGAGFDAVPALNDSERHLQALTTIILSKLTEQDRSQSTSA